MLVPIPSHSLNFVIFFAKKISVKMSFLEILCLYHIAKSIHISRNDTKQTSREVGIQIKLEQTGL